MPSLGRLIRYVECGGGGGRFISAKVWSGVLGSSLALLNDRGAKFRGRVIDMPALRTADEAWSVGEILALAILTKIAARPAGFRSNCGGSSSV